jgi:sterol desaturase/sphingolipid hydroxylase (fatty acid hydroxylase superfamily)
LEQALKIVTIEHTELAYYADFGVYLLTLLLLPGLLLHYTPTALRWELPVAALAGLVMWSLIEYAMHRLVFHGLEPFRSMHAQHHQRPLALIATPTIVSLGLIAVLVWLPASLLVGVWLGSGVTLGVTMGYFAYGVVHHGVHHWRANNAWLRQRKRQHAIHHHHSQVNYGVTTLWWDRVFGSCKPPLDHQE